MRLSCRQLRLKIPLMKGIEGQAAAYLERQPGGRIPFDEEQMLARDRYPRISPLLARPLVPRCPGHWKRPERSRSALRKCIAKDFNKAHRFRSRHQLAIDNVNGDRQYSCAIVAEACSVERWRQERRLCAIRKPITFGRHAHPIEVHLAVKILVMQNRDRVSAGWDSMKLARGRATVNRRPYFAVLLLPVARKSFGVIEEAASNTSLVVTETSDHYANLTSSGGISHYRQGRDHRQQYD